MKKLANQVINEIFRHMTITLTLRFDVPVRPMDAKGLKLQFSRRIVSKGKNYKAVTDMKSVTTCSGLQRLTGSTVTEYSRIVQTMLS